LSPSTSGRRNHTRTAFHAQTPSGCPSSMACSRSWPQASRRTARKRI
jgi:hypothetical protein